MFRTLHRREKLKWLAIGMERARSERPPKLALRFEQSRRPQRILDGLLHARDSGNVRAARLLHPSPRDRGMGDGVHACFGR